MIVYVKGVGLALPGYEHPDWLDALFAIPGIVVPVTRAPVGNALPAGERRRSSFTIKLAVDVARTAVEQAGADAQSLAQIFASSSGDTDTIHQICDALATPERLVSPTRFHNSVHNASAGYWSIATGSMQPSTSISAWIDSFATGLAEAAMQCLSEGVPVLLVAYDTPFPPPLDAVTPGRQAFGVSLLIDSDATGSLARLDMTVDADSRAEITPMREPGLESLRLDSSASRALPLLAALSAHARSEVVLGYSYDLRLRVLVTPGM